MAKKPSPTVLTDWREAARLFESHESVLGFDLETSGLKPKAARIAVIGLYGQNTHTAAILHVRGRDLDPSFAEWLGAPERKLIGHNLVGFDNLFLKHYGIPYRNSFYFDTMLGEQAVLVGGRKDVKANLKDTLKRRLHVAVAKDISHETWMQPELDDKQMLYLAEDIMYLPDLWQVQLARAREIDTTWGKEGWPGVTAALDFEMRLAPVVTDMMYRGLPLDLAALREYVDQQLAQLPELIAWLLDALGFTETKSLNHAPSVKKAINDRFDVALPSTDADELKLTALGDGPVAELASKLLAYRHATKREGMYDQAFIDKYTHEGRLYGTFRQLGTDTGRFASWNPNLQQLPRDMRHVIGGREGETLIAIDYNAIEVRAAAQLFQDHALIAALESEDIHRSVAAALFNIPEHEVTKEQRRLAKSGSFNLCFGGGAPLLYYKARVDGSDVTEGQIQEFTQMFFGRFTGVKRARDRAYAIANRGRPMPMRFPTGLLRVLVGPNLKGTTMLNNACQNLAATGLKHALIKMDERDLTQFIAAVVHDEVVGTAPDDIADEVAAAMEQAMLDGMAEVMTVPVAVERKVGRTWQ